MELKKIILFFTLMLYFGPLNAELVKPSNKLDPYDVVKIQLKALKNNNEKDLGIRQTWLFAHPDNKRVTGPYERFRIMIYGQLSIDHLLNHSSHKINLIMKYSLTNIFL